MLVEFIKTKNFGCIKDTMKMEIQAGCRRNTHKINIQQIPFTQNIQRTLKFNSEK